MSKSDAFEAAILDLIFLNANIPNIGDATGLRGSAAAGQLFVSLHTADPGEAGAQATNEVAYTGYARVGIARSAVGFNRSGSLVSLVANADFPTRSDAGSQVTATHFAIGVASVGSQIVLYKGPITPTIAITQGTTPRLPAATGINVTED